MLKPPYTRYSRIYTYHVDAAGFPPPDDPDLIGTWIEDDTTILIFHQPKADLVAGICRRQKCRIFYQADLAYEDWEMGRAIEPFSVGSLTIAPAWDAAPADIRIDPSVVFGNGFHPSTRLCLEMLAVHAPKLGRGFTGLDLGCGTGLLSIAAVRLGASQITAIDHNPLACEVTERNAAGNNAAKSIRVMQVDLRQELPATRVDVIMANLHPELLGGLFRDLSFWQARLYILSGFMVHAEEQLLAALPHPPPRLLERHARDKWRVWVLDGSQR